jgi:hypothetical protein
VLRDQIIEEYRARECRAQNEYREGHHSISLRTLPGQQLDKVVFTRRVTGFRRAESLAVAAVQLHRDAFRCHRLESWQARSL